MREKSIAFTSPLSSFFGVPRGDSGTIDGRALAFVGMPSDATHTSRIGTRFGPRALRRATSALMARLVSDAASEGLYESRSGQIVTPADFARFVDLGDVAIDEENVEATIEAIAAATRAAALSGALPVAIGGDHFNSYPACLGVSQALTRLRPGKCFGYIQIDGHLDFGDRLGAWGRFNHATNARRVSELPNIVRENMVWIGITGWVDGADVAEIEGFGGLIFTAEDWHRLGPQAVARRALAHAMRGCDSLYLSIDVDALDSGFLPGTGSIVHSEVTPRQYLDLLTALSSAPMCGLDFVEVSPPLDPSGRTEEIAARLLLEALRPHLLVPVGTPT
ncbi:MAG: agmatinase family protein [Gammaproteobacteria bacterium]|nr:agmatinase family protein [Gammaproteobacteria bacterium]